jgi:predicted acetyltransferase
MLAHPIGSALPGHVQAQELIALRTGRRSGTIPAMGSTKDPQPAMTRTSPTTLVLRPFSISDEGEARAAQAELASDGLTFLHGFQDDEPWASYLKRLKRLKRIRTGAEVPDGWVPETFLAAEVAGQLVGRASIRHRLNQWLAQWGGHIGYAVRPAFRRRGYATAILRQSLPIANDLGIQRVLVVCDEANVGSARVIERCGGVLESVVVGEDGSTGKRRYWFEQLGKNIDGDA